MLYDKFIRVVEDHAEELTKRWIDEVRHNEATPTYHQLNNEVLHKRVHSIYKRLGEWLLLRDLSNKENAEHFIKLGYERSKEGFKLSEVMYAIILIRTVLWQYVVDQGLINSTVDLYKALEFYNTINNFFDKANFFVAVGYEKGVGHPETEHKEKFVDGAVNAITKWIIKQKVS